MEYLSLDFYQLTVKRVDTLRRDCVAALLDKIKVTFFKVNTFYRIAQ